MTKVLFKNPKDFGIPETATKFDSPKAEMYGYLYYDKSGRPCARTFLYKGKKVYTGYYYTSEERRANHLARIIQDRINHKEAVAKRRKESNIETTLKVNDILVASWGYDQTNVDFYKVVEIVGKRKIKIVQIGCDQKINDFGNGMCGEVFPEVLNEIGKPFVKMVTDGDRVKVNSCAYARKWSGGACYNSWYG